MEGWSNSTTARRFPSQSESVMAYPPEIKLPQGHSFRWREDPARYLLRAGRNFRQPYLRIPNGARFTWPVGTEGFSYSSDAALAIHRYIGEEDIEVNVIYRDEPHIEMSGTFPGNTGPGLMRELLQVLEAKTPGAGKVLWLPYIFPRIQYVAAESWSFDHEANDRTRSLGYRISFIKVGVGRVISIPGPEEPQDPGQPPPAPPARYFRVRDGYRTLRRISSKVYKTEHKWHRIYNLNQKKLDAYFKKHKIPRHKFPTHRFPLGMRLRY
jgi:hypothetical protein